MMKLLPAVVAVIGTLVGTAVTRAQDGETTLPSVQLRRAFGRLEFHRPVQVTHAGDNRLFVVEQNGRIRVFENSPDHGTPGVFLDIRAKVRRKHNEEGLLSLAFHPNYGENGRFFIVYNAPKDAGDPEAFNSQLHVSEFRVSAIDPNRADPTSERILLEIEKPLFNH